MPDRANPLQLLTNSQLMERYRFHREGIRYIDQLISGRIQPATARSNSLSSLEKILLTLRFFATGGIQLNDADIHGVSQPTVSRAVAEVTNALSSPELVRRFIHFPTTAANLEKQSQEFFGTAGFPKVVGVIDGTHIRIKAPTENEEYFINRKGFHSVNIQLVMDAFDIVTDVVARWPGSTHDSRILEHSGIKEIFEGGHLPNGNYHLLGDSGYACKRWLLTPYLNPLPGSQSAYNRAHKRTRARIERGIGQLKRRFGILHSEVRLKPDKVCRVVVACVVLHNISKVLNIPLPDGEAGDEGNDDQPAAQNGPQIGLRYRDHFANIHF